MKFPFLGIVFCLWFLPSGTPMLVSYFHGKWDSVESIDVNKRLHRNSRVRPAPCTAPCPLPTDFPRQRQLYVRECIFKRLIIVFWYLLFPLSILFLKKILFIFRQREREREREGEKHQCVAPHQGPGPQCWHVPWLGIELATLWFAGQCLIHWGTPAWAINTF